MQPWWAFASFKQCVKFVDVVFPFFFLQANSHQFSLHWTSENSQKQVLMFRETLDLQPKHTFRHVIVSQAKPVANDFLYIYF